MELIEGSYDTIYFDPRSYETTGIGKLVTPNEILSNSIWNLTPLQKKNLIKSINLIRPLFNKKTGIFKDVNSEKQPNLFENIYQNGNKYYPQLTTEQVNAMNEIYSHRLNEQRKKELVYEHYIKYGVPQIKGFLEHFNIDFDKLPEGNRDNVLDISYNPGENTPLYKKTKNGGVSYYPKLGYALKNGYFGMAGVQTRRIGVGRNRNNYTLLRSMKELSHMKPKALYNFISNNIEEELTPQNFPLYQKRFNWLENPFKENERILKENNF